jgi:predicted ATP-dependent Lon-type protease
MWKDQFEKKYTNKKIKEQKKIGGEHFLLIVNSVRDASKKKKEFFFSIPWYPYI